MILRGQRWLIGAGLLSLAGVASAQETSLERFERQLEQIQRDTRLRVDMNVPAGQRTLVDYGGFTTFSFLSIDDIDAETHLLGQYDLNLYGRVNIDGVHDFFMRIRTSYRSFSGEDEFDDDDNGWQDPAVQIDRATYRFDLARYLAAYEGKQIQGNVVVQGGRQLVHWANGLVLSDDIDGGLVTLNYRAATLLILAGVTREENFDFDSSRPGFDDETDRGFYGGMFTYEISARHRPFVYGLVQRDHNDNDTITTDPNGAAAPAPFTTEFEYDSYYIGFGSNGALSDQLLYAVEMVYQGGEGLSGNPEDPDTGEFGAQTEEDISAFAADFRLDYLFPDQNRSRLTGEFLLATGDTDRGDGTTTLAGNRSGTDDHGFNAFGLINTGLAFAPNVSNLLMLRVGASTFPLPNHECFDRLQVGVDTFLFHKFNENAPIDEPTDSDEGFLGGEIDLYANWEIASDVSLAVRYGLFIPGEAVESNGDPRHFFYTGLTFSF